MAPSAKICCSSLFWVFCLSVILATDASAQSSNPGPGLLDARLDFANDVERAAAAANQSTFNALDSVCNPAGILDTVASPADQLRPESCTPLQFFVYLTARELVHSANALLGEGATIASLNVDQRGLGTALRWTAAEEIAAQGSMATQFSSNQLANFGSRIAALRLGSTGFTVAGFGLEQNPLGRHALGVVQSERSASYSPWGGFLNGSFGQGDKRATGNENAFDYDVTEIALGLDYRLSNGWVIGGIATYSDQSVEFNTEPGSVSVVDGRMDGSGLGAVLFGLYASDTGYLSLSLATQQVDYDLVRDIVYPSFNPAVEASNSRTTSEPEADILGATIDIGRTFSFGIFSVEPSLGLDYQDVTIDSFSESRSFSRLNRLADTDAFNLIVAEQAFESLDVSLGVRFQWTLTPDFGVLAPYATIEYHNELEDDSRLIRARYAGAGNEAFTFAVPTNPFDSEFFTWSVGMTSVVRGARQRSAGGPAAGGVSLFAQYQSVERLDNYDEGVISAGIRYEF